MAAFIGTSKEKLFNEECFGHCKLLSESDFEGYKRLKENFAKEIANSKKGEKVEVFVKRLEEIKEFVVRNDGNDWRRSFATGVIFYKDYLGINIKQLIALLGKCKSSINGSLHQLGYVSRPASKEIDDEIVKSIPYFCNDKKELKKWTIRQKKQFKKKNQVVNSIPIINNNVTPPSEISSDYENSIVDNKSDAVWKYVQYSFPCPVKFRYKMYSALYQSVSIQTDA